MTIEVTVFVAITDMVTDKHSRKAQTTRNKTKTLAGRVECSFFLAINVIDSIHPSTAKKLMMMMMTLNDASKRGLLSIDIHFLSLPRPVILNSL